MLIAEIGVNHLGSVKFAKQMIDIGIMSGIKYFKFQIYKMEELCDDTSWVWYSYMKHCALTGSQYIELNEYCKANNVTFFASVFGDWSLSIAKSINLPIYKIASRSLFDNNNISKFAQMVINTGKPVIASLGNHKWDKPLPAFANVKYLYCVSKYPTLKYDIKWPQFNDQITGFSDHTIGTETTIEAIKLGAKIIEKHFTIDKTLFGPDQIGSATPEEMSHISSELQAR